VAEKSIRWDDPTLNIQWPLVNGQAPQLSAKDVQGSLFAQAEVFA
jgi:dTDP-4-dehydrorhamnose 3,5-epimerase